jgi:hypothetical protein
VFRRPRRSACRRVPGPPPPACVARLSYSGRSRESILYCCQIPARKQQLGREGERGGLF